MRRSSTTAEAWADAIMTHAPHSEMLQYVHIAKKHVRRAAHEHGFLARKCDTTIESDNKSLKWHIMNGTYKGGSNLRQKLKVTGFRKKARGQGWRKVKVAVDSGAAESVIPIDLIQNYAKIPHSCDEYFQTASGEPIKNEGEQRIPVVTPSGQLKGMTFQACDVTKPLASVKRMMDAGHAVVFAPVYPQLEDRRG